MRRASILLLASPLFSVVLFAACGNNGGTGGAGTTSGGDAGYDGAPYIDANLPDGSLAHPCKLPGSLQFTGNGTVLVPGGPAGAPDLSYLTLPAGFCAHYFGTVGNARQLRFAPGGELFVASPTALATGMGKNGESAIVILPDDNHDGLADTPIPFLSFAKGSTNQGMLFTPGFFYYQDGTPPGTRILRMPYAPGDRKPSGTGVEVADVNVYTSGLHWPKTLDVADDGTIYVGNGGDQGETCVEPHPFHGGILSIDPAPGGPNPGGVQIAKGLRNPYAIRCARGHDRCFALELAKDYTAGQGGREKMVPLRKGDDWGFPCCASNALPYSGTPAGTDCSAVAQDDNSFYIGDTPFGLDFEPGLWPSPWGGQAYVATHGHSGTWLGARIVAIAMDPKTGLPLPSSNKDDEPVSTGAMTDFATGWFDHATNMATAHGRPAALAFSDDGRLFVADNFDGIIFWIAPLGL